MRGATAPDDAHALLLRISIHAPHARGDDFEYSVRDDMRFQSTPLMRGATPGRCGLPLHRDDFNPRPSCEGRPAASFRGSRSLAFQSTPLMRGATQTFVVPADDGLFQSTPLMRGATSRHGRCSLSCNFNPRPSCEGRPALYNHEAWLARFQSTPLMRGATRLRARRDLGLDYFNPRPSCEGRHLLAVHEDGDVVISIHAPHARGDGVEVEGSGPGLISIHAPHARGDALLSRPVTSGTYFNPRPSCEGRPGRGGRGQRPRAYFNPRPSCEGRLFRCIGTAGMSQFQSTPLMRGATPCHAVPLQSVHISIHAPHARGDGARRGWRSRWRHFNPRPSCEGRRSSVSSGVPP